MIQSIIQFITQQATDASIPLIATCENFFEKDKKGWTPEAQAWVQTTHFQGKPRTLCLVPKNGQQLSQVIYGVSTDPFEAFWDAAFLASHLPSHHTYHFESAASQTTIMAWALASYYFHIDKNQPKAIPTLYVKDSINLSAVKATIDAIFLIRTLINRPANLLTPADLASQAQTIAKKNGATFKEIIGDNLLKENYPLIHTVGKAATTPPRFVEITWGDPKHFHLVLVGKGITFDTGGLHIKTGHYMNLMKKDMGGAAHALGLSAWIMDQKLPIHLTLCLPIAENAIAGNAMRPGDIVRSRSGLSVAIEDTDAEGRLILADALTRAAELTPDLIIDFATLTGAARVALGTDLPALFTNREAHQETLMNVVKETLDPLWPLPLWAGYKESLKSPVADLQNISTSPQGGAITAALFLQKFVGTTPWIHMDMMAWNMHNRPGRPVGGDAQAFRTFCSFVENICSR